MQNTSNESIARSLEAIAASVESLASEVKAVAASAQATSKQVEQVLSILLEPAPIAGATISLSNKPKV